MLAVLALVAALGIGVDLPKTGTDGAEGLRLRDAVTLAAADARVGVQPLAGPSAIRNPHQDEGSDNGADVAAAPSLVRAAARAGIGILIGPLRSNVALAMAPALQRAHAVAISGTAREPSTPLAPIFKLSPSEHQLAAAAFAGMRRRFGSRICVLDDGSAEGMRRARVLLALDPTLEHGSCLDRADAVYFSGLAGEPVFCSAHTARLADPRTLLVALSHRDFAPERFAGAGDLFRAEPRAIRRTPQVDDVARRYHARAFVAADDQALRFYAAVQVGAAARQRATRTGASVAAVLRSTTFPTILGNVRFTRTGDLANPEIVVRKLT